MMPARRSLQEIIRGGSSYPDEYVISGTDFDNHHARHEHGGGDEIDLVNITDHIEFGSKDYRLKKLHTLDVDFYDTGDYHVKGNIGSVSGVFTFTGASIEFIATSAGFDFTDGKYLKLPNSSGSPAGLEDGHIYYDYTGKKFKGKENGVLKDLITTNYYHHTQHEHGGADEVDLVTITDHISIGSKFSRLLYLHTNNVSFYGGSSTLYGNIGVTSNVLTFDALAYDFNASTGGFDFSTGTHLRVPIVTSDPGSPADGDIWYRSDLNQLRLRKGGVTVRFNVTAV